MCLPIFMSYVPIRRWALCQWQVAIFLWYYFFHKIYMTCSILYYCIIVVPLFCLGDSPLMRKVYEMEPCRVDNNQLHHIENVGTLWRYRQQITIGHLTHHLTRLSAKHAEEFKLLQLVIQNVRTIQQNFPNR